MLASKRSLRLSRRSAFLLGSGSVAVAVAVGCGGGSDTSTGSFGGSGGATTTKTSSTGEGGTLFTFASSSSSSGSTGSMGGGGTGGTTGSTTTTGPMCDGNPTTGPGKWAVKNADDAQGQYGQAIAADPFGNVYVTGTYKGTMKLGAQQAEAVNPTYLSMFVAKLDSTGAPQWIHGYAPTPPPGNGIPRVAGQAIAADDQGNVYALGDITGVSNLGGKSVASTGGFFGDSFLVKYNTTGTVSWLTRIGETQPSAPNGKFGTQAMHAIALHKNATGFDVLVGGDTQGTLDLGGGMTLAASGTASQAAFIGVYRSGDGGVVFAKLLGDGSTNQTVYGAVWSPTGEIVITGKAAGPVTFPGGVVLTPAGTQAAFVAKIKGDGSSTVWAKLYGSKTAVGKGVAVDGSGNVFVTGDHKGDVDFGGGPLSNDFGDNVFVAKLDGAGNHIWSHTYGDSTGQQALGISVDAMGRAVVVGEYSGSLDFGGGAITAGGQGQDGFVAKLDTQGCQVWAKTIGDAEYQSAKGVALDSMGNASIVGAFKGTLTFGGVSLSGPTGMAVAEDVFIAQLAP
jgi:hypothetical protein